MPNYFCEICQKESSQKKHHQSHIETEIHQTKKEVVKLKMESISAEERIEKYSTDNLETILDKLENSKKVKKIIKKVNKINISNKEALKDKIHDIHNFLRNNGGGYGMNALKVFNIIYGLKKIEENNLIDKSGLKRPYCEFSYLLSLANDCKDKELTSTIYNEILNSLHDSVLKDILFYEIPKSIQENVFQHLVKEIEELSAIEKATNTQLCGKIYEYFIGRDQTAISELGAYFTDRHITDFLYNEEPTILNEELEVPTMCDPFGGSGGFTVGFIVNLKSRYPNINWKTQIGNVHHYDMNEDVIKSAALEFFCLTKHLPNMSSLKYANSLKDEFNNQRFKKIFTNPPYGGDDNKKSQKQSKRNKVKNFIKEQLKTEENKETIELREAQLKEIDSEEKSEKKIREQSKVTLVKSSARIQAFAKKHGLKGNDKESVSLIQLMDLVDVGGTVVGVLKEGVFFNKIYKGLRECLIKNFNVRKVISIPSDQFENTSTKTSALVFDNTEEKTSVVEFSELAVEKFSEDIFEEIEGQIVCTGYSGEGSKLKPDVKNVEKKIVSMATAEEILANDTISFNGKDYIKDEIVPGEGYELKRLGDVCEIKNGKQLDKKNIVNGEFPVYGGGKNIISYHNDFNRENATIIAGTGNYSGFVNFVSGKFWASQCFTIKSENVIKNKYIYYFCKSQQSKFMNSQGGSAQQFIRGNSFKKMLLPFPKTPEKIQYWVDKISAPFNEKNEKKKLLENREQEVLDRVKFISENEECEITTIKGTCNISKGIGVVKEQRTGGKFPYYASNGHISGSYMNKYNKEGTFILLAEDGTIGSKHYIKDGTKIYVGDHVHILKTKNISCYFIYLSLNLVNFDIYTTGSVIPKLNKRNLEKIKLSIPKNKKLITELEPKFGEIEQLKLDIKDAETRFEQFIVELGNEAIKK